MALTANQFNLVYDVLSFSLATMMATTIFLWMRVVSKLINRHVLSAFRSPNKPTANRILTSFFLLLLSIL